MQRTTFDCTAGTVETVDLTADEEAAIEVMRSEAAKDAERFAALHEVVAAARAVLAAKVDPKAVDPSTDELLAALAVIGSVG